MDVGAGVQSPTPVEKDIDEVTVFVLLVGINSVHCVWGKKPVGEDFFTSWVTARSYAK